MEYATIESRLATFEPPTKRSKLGWPHKTPTPEDLARAGFYYKPSKASNDNTICYLCERQLAGWEPDDDPVEEHLKHSQECGWAILMNAAQDKEQDTATMEDPTGQLLAEARRATYAIGWPHEPKRAWRCKVEKMVEAGWHFAPVTDGEDYVSCAYCKLSLDGWEPKDDPFHEHHRRSPQCVFFHFAGTSAPAKRPKAKKGRASKTSRSSKASTRLSSQSNTQDITLLSEAASAAIDDIPDLEDSIDASEMSSMSVMSTASTATTKGKRKGAGGRAKTTKAKKAKTTRSTKVKKEDPEPEPEQVSEQVQKVEIAMEVDPEQMLAQPEDVEVVVEIPASSQPDLLPSPAPSLTAEVSYPSMPVNNTPPSISNERRHLSPVGAPPDNSPTPVKPRSTRSSLGSARPTPKSSAAKSHPQSAAAERSSPPPEQQETHSSPAPSPSHSTSDIENAPPSTRSPASRPPVHTSSISPFPHLPQSTPGHQIPQFTPSDIEVIFHPASPAKAESEILLALTGSKLSDKERKMTVQEWIEFVATQAEEGLRAESERVVSVFEKEGQRALGVLEGVTCVSPLK